MSFHIPHDAMPDHLTVDMIFNGSGFRAMLNYVNDEVNSYKRNLTFARLELLTVSSTSSLPIDVVTDALNMYEY